MWRLSYTVGDTARVPLSINSSVPAFLEATDFVLDCSPRLDAAAKVSLITPVQPLPWFAIRESIN